MLTQILDSTPILYLFAVAVVLRSLGSYISEKYKPIAFFQYACGASTWGFLLLRRMVLYPPQELLEVIATLIQTGAFGMIAFGMVGAVGTVISLTSDGSRWVYGLLKQRKDARQEASRRQAEQLRLQRDADRRPSSEDRERERRERAEQANQAAIDQQQVEARLAEELARKRTIRLQRELQSQAVMEQNHRQSIREFIDNYMEDDLPLDEYERRNDIIMEHISQQRTVKHKEESYSSITDIENAFVERLNEVESLNQSQAEKQSLRAYILMEKNNAIQNFLRR